MTAFASATPLSAQTAWNQEATGFGVAEHAMAYDPVRDVVVLFGGRTGDANSAPNGDTWEWDGANWTQVNVQGPAPRKRHTMVYDKSSSGVVLFGGSDGGTYYGDTWVYDGAWTLVANTGPAPRAGHAMAAAKYGSSCLFGGRGNGTSHNDTWIWQNGAWTQQSPPGIPAPGGNVAMSYDPPWFRWYLVRDDVLWSYSMGSSWTPRDVGTIPSTGGTLDFDPVRDRLVFVSDSSAGLPVETWEWDGQWTQVPTAIGNRTYHAAAVTPVGILVHGGGGRFVSSPPIDDTWELSTVAPPATTTYGINCSSQGCSSSAAKPWLGETWRFSIGICDPVWVQWLFVGLTRLTTPVNLGVVGAPTCSLYTSSEFAVLPADVDPIRAIWDFPIPNDPSLVGGTFQVQPVLIFSLLLPPMIETYEATEVVVGWR